MPIPTIQEARCFQTHRLETWSLMSQHFMEGRWQEGIRYLAAAVGICSGSVYCREDTVSAPICKTSALETGHFVSGDRHSVYRRFLMPEKWNLPATIMVSFACAMQVQTFRKVGGYSYASTMCIGNLRSGTAALSVWCREKKPEQLEQALYYFGIIFFLP